jgi:hypothetical protein
MCLEIRQFLEVPLSGYSAGDALRRKVAPNVAKSMALIFMASTPGSAFWLFDLNNRADYAATKQVAVRAKRHQVEEFV